MIKRSSGVLMHVSSLFNDYSIGSFGEETKQFIDFLSDTGFTWWQVLPFCMVDECNSPYKSYSAFGGNPYFVDLKILRNKGLLTDDELNECRQQQPYSCEFTRLYHTRFDTLKKASERVTNRSEIEEFAENHKYIKQFCEFMALKSANGEKPWTEWTNTEIDPTILFMWKFIQYEFFMQWADIKIYANSKGIKIIGDIPIYVSFDSADVWANREMFELTDDNKPKCVAGVPPDYFCKDGQLWGNPLYNWDVMEKDGYSWWIDRLRHMFSMFDGVRIDHFRGIESYWSVPGNAKTAAEGEWKKGPGKKFVDAVNAVRGEKLIIAEDLGDITEDVTELVKYSGFPGMRVFQFGFLGDYDNPHMPHNYDSHCVAYTGTHDNNTLLGYVWELSEQNRREMLDYCGYTDPDWNHGYDSILRSIYVSNSPLVIFPIQDLLGYGSDTRLNIPGKADGNWQFRITRDQLNSIDREKFRHFNHIYRR